jgi:deoxycytidine triphosphate deaminase
MARFTNGASLSIFFKTTIKKGIAMPVKSDQWIIEMCQRHRMIEPFEETQIRKGISFGVSSYGYDISLSDEFKTLKAAEVEFIDPKNNRTPF